MWEERKPERRAVSVPPHMLIEELVDLCLEARVDLAMRFDHAADDDFLACVELARFLSCPCLLPQDSRLDLGFFLLQLSDLLLRCFAFQAHHIVNSVENVSLDLYHMSDRRAKLIDRSAAGSYCEF